MPYRSNLKVEVLRHTPEPEKAAALAAKLCYSDSDISALSEKVTSAEQSDFISKISGMGHHSVFEHVSFTFGIEGVSRTLTHQLVRHRIASYSQKSQRYVSSKNGFSYILPHTVEDNGEALKIFEDVMSDIEKAYARLSALGIPAEDARYTLPNACETKLIMTMNARELLHFFSLRSCNRAQWEIREMSDLMLQHCYRLAPNIFKKAGPSCVRGACSEGAYTCGKSSEVKERISELKTIISTGDL